MLPKYGTMASIKTAIGGNDYDQDGDGEMSIDYFGVDCDDLDAEVGTFAEEIFMMDTIKEYDGLSDYDFDGDGEESDMIGSTDCNDILASINTAVEFGTTEWMTIVMA